MKHLLLTIAALAFAVTASAQANINKLVSKLENSDSADLTYVEKRDPATHRIISAQFIFIIPSSEIKNIISTIANDRNESVSYERIGNKLYRAKFENGDETTNVVFVIDRPSISDQAFMAGVPWDVKGDNILVVKRQFSTPSNKK